MNITRALKSRWLLYVRHPPSLRAADTAAAEAKVVVTEAAAVVKEEAAPGGETMEAQAGATVEATVVAGPKAETV